MCTGAQYIESEITACDILQRRPKMTIFWAVHVRYHFCTVSTQSTKTCSCQWYSPTPQQCSASPYIDCSLPICLCSNQKCLHWCWIHMQPVIQRHRSVCHTDESNKVKTIVCGSSIFCLWWLGRRSAGSRSIGQSDHLPGCSALL